MRPLLLGTLLVLVAAGGCLGGDEGGPTAPPGTTTRTPTLATAPPEPGDALLAPPFSYEDCRGVRFTHQALREDVQALLPDGYEARESPAGSGLAAVVWTLHECGGFTIGAGVINGTWFGHAGVPVEPPESQFPDRDLEADRHEVLLQVLSAQAPFLEFWTALGYPAYNGTAALEVTDPGGLDVGRVVTAGLGEHALQATATADGGALDGIAMRFTPHPDGATLIWRDSRELAASHAGPAELAVPADSPFAGLMAGDRLPGQAQLVSGTPARDVELRLWTPSADEGGGQDATSTSGTA